MSERFSKILLGAQSLCGHGRRKMKPMGVLTNIYASSSTWMQLRSSLLLCCVTIVIIPPSIVIALSHRLALLGFLLITNIVCSFPFLVFP
jgi:hypothetical protein